MRTKGTVPARTIAPGQPHPYVRSDRRRPAIFLPETRAVALAALFPRSTCPVNPRKEGTEAETPKAAKKASEVQLGSVADWITAIAAVATVGIALYAARVGISTFRHQRTSFDVQLALGIFESINRYWDRLVSEPEHYTYNMGQILAQFELAATLFNSDVLTRTAEPILKDHIVEVFALLTTSEEGRRTINACSSSRDTFKELRKFFAKNAPTALRFLDFQERQAAPQ